VLDRYGRLLVAALGFGRPAWPLARSRALGAPDLARLLVRHRPDRRGMYRQGFGPPADPVRRARLAGDVLYDRDGTLTDECHGLGLGADAMARSPERREGCAQALTERGPTKECRT